MPGNIQIKRPKLELYNFDCEHTTHVVGKKGIRVTECPVTLQSAGGKVTRPVCNTPRLRLTEQASKTVRCTGTTVRPSAPYVLAEPQVKMRESADPYAHVWWPQTVLPLKRNPLIWNEYSLVRWHRSGGRPEPLACSHQIVLTPPWGPGASTAVVFTNLIFWEVMLLVVLDVSVTTSFLLWGHSNTRPPWSVGNFSVTSVSRTT